jgi:hypothetical protein
MPQKEYLVVPNATAEVRRNPDGTYTGRILQRQGWETTRPTKDELLKALARDER